MHEDKQAYLEYLETPSGQFSEWIKRKIDMELGAPGGYDPHTAEILGQEAFRIVLEDAGVLVSEGTLKLKSNEIEALAEDARAYVDTVEADALKYTKDPCYLPSEHRFVADALEAYSGDRIDLKTDAEFPSKRPVPAAPEPKALDFRAALSERASALVAKVTGREAKSVPDFRAALAAEQERPEVDFHSAMKNDDPSPGLRM